MADKKRIKIVVTVVIVLVIFFFLGRSLYQNIQDLTQKGDTFRMHWPSLLLAMVLLAVYFGLQSLRWRKIVVMTGDRMRPTDGVKVWFCSQLAKYIPGKVMTVVGRVYLANRYGVTKTRATVAMILEIGLLIITGVMLFIASVPFRQESSGWTIWMFLLIPAGLVAVHPWVVNQVVSRGMRLLKKEAVNIPLTSWQMARLIVYYLIQWQVYGLSYYFLLRGLDVDTGNFLVLTSTFAAAWVAGYVAFIFPSGLGVREGVAAGLLTPMIGPAMAVVVPLMGRLLWTVMEAGGALLFRSAVLSVPTRKSDKLTVALVAACPFPGNRGTPSRILRMAEALADRGHKVHVVTYHYGTDTPVRGVTVHRIPNVGGVNFASGPSYKKLLIFDPMLTWLLRRVVFKHKVDIIHAHHFEGALVAHLARGFHSIPVIYDAHTTLAGELHDYRFPMPRFLKSYFARRFDRTVPAASDHVIAVSETLKEILVDNTIPPEKIDVVPTGVNLDAFDHGRADIIANKYGLRSDKVVVYTGSTAAFQGVHHILEAAPGVVAQEPEATIFIVGDDPGEKMAALAQEKGVADNVIITGERPFTEVAHFLAIAKVAIIPRTECPGIPQKLSNYMAARKAVACFEGSAKLLEHEVNGLIVENGNAQQMADAIVRLLRDDMLARRLGEAARESLIGKYDWPSLAAKTEAIYDGLVGGPKDE